jgi:hypothetical protein
MQDVCRFFESGRFGESTDRQLFVATGRDNPPAAEGCRWSVDAEFDADQVLANSSGFGAVIAAVRRDGFAIVSRTA